MAVPKRKTGKARGNSRYANWKLENPSVSECPKCHELKQNHRVCSSCGYYDGKAVVDMTKDTKAE